MNDMQIELADALTSIIDRAMAMQSGMIDPVFDTALDAVVASATATLDQSMLDDVAANELMDSIAY